MRVGGTFSISSLIDSRLPLALLKILMMMNHFVCIVILFQPTNIYEVARSMLCSVLGAGLQGVETIQVEAESWDLV